MFNASTESYIESWPWGQGIVEGSHEVWLAVMSGGWQAECGTGSRELGSPSGQAELECADGQGWVETKATGKFEQKQIYTKEKLELYSLHPNN